MVVEPLQEDKTAGGIILPAASMDNPTAAYVKVKVTAVSDDKLYDEKGEDITHIRRKFSVGDVVACPPPGALTSPTGRAEAFLIDERNVVGVITQE